MVLKTGTRIKDRRLDNAADLRKCLAFDAVTAVHVLTVLVRPETPATKVFQEEDLDLLSTLLEAQGHRNVVRSGTARHQGGSHRHRAPCRLSSLAEAAAPGNEKGLAGS